MKKIFTSKIKLIATFLAGFILASSTIYVPSMLSQGYFKRFISTVPDPVITTLPDTLPDYHIPYELSLIHI